MIESNAIQDSRVIRELENIMELVNTTSVEQISEFYGSCNSSGVNGGKKDLEEIEPKEQAPEELTPLLQLASKTFATREELQDCVREIALQQGYATNIKRSKPAYYVIIGCDRGGTYRGSNVPIEQRKRLSGSCLINCPFEIKGRRIGDIWKVEIKTLLHNHEPSTDMSGHPICRRFSSEDMHTIRTMSMAGCAPREILTALRKSNHSIQAISRTVYNAKVKIKNEDLRGRTPLEALLEELGGGGFMFERDNNDYVTRLFFSHPSSMILTKNFYHVFVMDCTYKTNKYGMPLLYIIGISSFNTSFYSCMVFLQREEEEDYIWALERFKKILNVEKHY